MSEREREKEREREREKRERERERERVQSMMLSIGKECLAYHSFALASKHDIPCQKHFFAKKSNKQILRKKKTIFILQPFVVSRCRQ